MSTTLEQLAEQALTIPGESRARLADILVESLGASDLNEVEQQWLREAKRRRDEVRAGRVQSTDGNDAIQKVRDSLRG